mmetsp:Transcript_23120/g.58988  ORF Transcript_23120/g.58988 Transcript_23120/m.58988 type:complete len:346 (+) Transcript_23120:135-1172(+)
MPAAHSEDLAWRVVVRIEWKGQSVEDVTNPDTGLDVSRHYVNSVMERYHTTGTVKTRQGRGADPLKTCSLTRAEDYKIVQMIFKSPRTKLKDHRAAFQLETGVLISYSAFCSAVKRLGYSRKHVRNLCYTCDMDRANAWLAETLTYFPYAEMLAVLDETSKDFDTLKGDFGYSLRGQPCTVQDQYLTHQCSRVSALVLHTLDGGFTDWAFTPGTFTKDYFLHVTTEPFRDWRGALRPPMLLPHLQPRQQRRMCVLLDNASIHSCHEFDTRVLAVRGCCVRFIPPYAKHLSTVDNGGFGALVHWLQGHHDYVQTVGINEAMEDAFHALNGDGGRLARYCFRNCGYM